MIYIVQSYDAILTYFNPYVAAFLTEDKAVIFCERCNELMPKNNYGYVGVAIIDE